MGQGYTGKPLFASTFTYAWTKVYGEEWVKHALADEVPMPGQFPPAGMCQALRRAFPDRDLQLFHEGSTLITKARCHAAGAFLRSGADVLVSFDDDVVTSPDVLRSLVAACEEVKTLVSAPCIVRSGTNINWVLEGDRFDRARVERTGDAWLYPVERIGFGLFAIHRLAMEQMAAAAEWITTESAPPYPACFREDVREHSWIGEDFHFTERMRSMGMQPYALLDVVVWHAGHSGSVTTEGVLQCDPDTAKTLVRKDRDTPTFPAPESP